MGYEREENTGADVSKALQDGYARRFTKYSAYREKVWQILCRAFFVHYIPSNSILLDLGAGWGEFSRHVTAAKIFAMDLNPHTAERVRGFAEFLQQDCSKRWPLEEMSLDVVFTSNFLEHLPTKTAVDSALQEAHRCLRVGGEIICIGPNVRFVPGAYWDYWDHHVPISDRSMCEALELRGFIVKKCIPRFLPYTMSDGWNPPLAFVKLYLRMPAIWALFGKQFFIVASKR